MNDTHTTEQNSVHTPLSDAEVLAAFEAARLAMATNEGARLACDQLKRLRGRMNDEVQVNQCYQLFGHCMFVLGDFPAAVAWLQEGDSNSLMLGDALLSMGKREEAKEQYRKAGTIPPQSDEHF